MDGDQGSPFSNKEKAIEDLLDMTYEALEKEIKSLSPQAIVNAANSSSYVSHSMLAALLMKLREKQNDEIVDVTIWHSSPTIHLIHS
jgi:hypothetical protein